jgi:hypothetical protein
MAAPIILRGDRPGQDRIVVHNVLSHDYRLPLPDFVDEHGRVWRHVNPQAWAPPDRRIPVYDRIFRVQ